jgi:hypothetical protein
MRAIKESFSQGMAIMMVVLIGSNVLWTPLFAAIIALGCFFWRQRLDDHDAGNSLCHVGRHVPQKLTPVYQTAGEQQQFLRGMQQLVKIMFMVQAVVMALT